MDGTAEMASTTVVSSPGKVLLAGGYLVLDPRYSGVVVSTSSRFYTVIHRDLHSKGSQDNGLIRVRSPQFLDAVWQYSVTVDGGVVDVAEHANRYETWVSLPSPTLMIAVGRVQTSLFIWRYRKHSLWRQRSRAQVL